MSKFSILGLIIFLLGCVTEPKFQSSQLKDSVQKKININNRIRNYRIYIPENLGTKQNKLVFVFHGGMGTAEFMEYISGFNRIAEREKFIVVYPNGTGKAENKFLTWNSWKCCGYALEKKVDDVKYIQAIINEIKENYSIDSSRIFATGFSNGGMMSLKLACDTNDFRAVASVGGSMFHLDCKPKKSVSVLLINGRKDMVVPYSGGVGTNSLTKSAKLPIEKVYEFWREQNQCENETKIEDEFNPVQYSKTCNDKTEVRLVEMKLEAHTWPSGNNLYLSDESNDSFKTSEEIWKFFSKQ
ncbi:MAG: PHB depolymerase family esterase [Leptospiraceae bacterium]|nr:PHB depolymerase family esterase [Leptospiraceae bacterium]